jgi:hypothetical protein
MNPTTSVGFSPSTPAADSGFQNAVPRSDGGTPLQRVSMEVPNTGGAAVKTANYTAVAGDCGKTLVFNSASALTLTLPASIPLGPGSATFTQWNIEVQNIGAGALTVSPNGLDLDGSASSLTLAQNTGIGIATDSTNYFSERGVGGAAITLEHDGTNNSSQTVLNLKSSSSIQVTDLGAGAISLATININQPVIRGSGLVASGSASSLTVTLPSGTQAGDFAVIFFAGDFTPSLPSGWTSIATDSTGTGLTALAASKTLTSGDISTGSVTVSMGGTQDCTLAIVTFIGATGGVREFEQGVATSPGTITNVTSGAVLNTDAAIYFAAQRAGTTGSTLPTITPGSGVASTLQSNNTVSGIASILADQAMPGGALSVVSHIFNTSGGGGWAIQVIVEGVSSGVGSVSSVGLTVPSRQSVSGSPVTGAGTLAITDNNESANTFFRGPTSGSPAAPTFGAIVSADLPVGSASQIGGVQVDGTSIVASAGVISATASLSNPMTTVGDIIVGGTAGAPTRLAAGTSGGVLTSNGPGVAPSYQPGGGGGGGVLVLLGAQTASSSAELDFTSLITSTYNKYVLEFENILPATSGASLLLQVSTNNGSSWDTTSGHYEWAANFSVSGAAQAAQGSTSAAAMTIAQNVYSLSGDGGLCGTMSLYLPLNASQFKFAIALVASSVTSNSDQLCIQSMTGRYRQSAAYNAFRILFSAGNIASGTVRVYGQTH